MTVALTLTRPPLKSCSKGAGRMLLCEQCGSLIGGVTNHAHESDVAPPAPKVVKLSDVSLKQPVVPKALAVVAPAVQAAGPPPSPPSSVSSSKEPSEPSKPKARKAPLKPWHLRLHKQRLVVRRAIYCQVPGINRVRAEAIVEAYPTISALMRADVKSLAAIPIKNAPLGMGLAEALKRVFE